MMSDKEFISRLPLKRTWISDIVDILLKRPNGESEIEAIVLALTKTDRNLGAEAESTVTRSINNYCINAGDVENNVDNPLFERVAPGTYKLISFPETPDLIEIQNIEFADRAYQEVWKAYKDIQKRNNRNWVNKSKRDQLVQFSRDIIEDEDWTKLLELQQKITRAMAKHNTINRGLTRG